MASSIASLFGPTAEEIVYARQQEDQARRQQQLQQGLAMQASPLAQQYYQAGYNIVSGLGGLFGQPMMDPRLTQAVKIRQVLGDTDVDDLNDPAALSKLSQKFQDEGLVREAVYFADRAKDLTAQQIQLQKLTQPKLAKELITKDGRLVATDTFGGLYDYETNERLTKDQVQLATTYKAAQKPAEAASGTAQKQAINFLKERTDLGVGDRQQAGTALANIANSLEGVEDYNEALEQAFLKMQQEQKLTDTGFEVFGIGSKWGWNPEGVAVPLRPTTSGDQDWKVLSDETSNTVPKTTKLR